MAVMRSSILKPELFTCPRTSSAGPGQTSTQEGKEEERGRIPTVRSCCCQQQKVEGQDRACPIPAPKVTSQVGPPPWEETLGLGNKSPPSLHLSLKHTHTLTHTESRTRGCLLSDTGDNELRRAARRRLGCNRLQEKGR